MLASMVWGTYAVKIEVQMGNCLIVEGSKMLARMVWGTYNHQHGDLTKLLNSVRKLSAPECPVDGRGGGGQSLFGQCPFEPGDIFGGASLSVYRLDLVIWALTSDKSICIKRDGNAFTCLLL